MNNNNRRYSPVPPTNHVSVHSNANHHGSTRHRIFTFISLSSLLITALIAAIKIKHRYNIQTPQSPQSPLVVVNDGHDKAVLSSPSSSPFNKNINIKDDGKTISTKDSTSTSISIPFYNNSNNDNNIEEKEKSTKVAFIGNSILYYNDSPRFLSKLVSVSTSQQTQTQLYQDSCLRGGASLVSIYTNGNGMEEKFHTIHAKRRDGTYDIGSPTIQSLLEKGWDYVIMNDYTQQPARISKRLETINILKEKYISLFYNNNKLTIPILLMTHAYRKPVKNSMDLFPISNFTKLLCEGYQEYARVIDDSFKKLLPNDNNSTKITRIAYVGKAYEIIYNENKQLWEKLFYIDDLHPSTYGTILQGFVLYCTIYFDSSDKVCNPPIFEYESDIRNLWSDARRMYPPEDNVVVHYPNVDEVNLLRDVAIRVWELSMGDSTTIC